MPVVLRHASTPPQRAQGVSGLIMWVGMAAYYLAVLAAVFVIWANHEEREEAALEASQAGQSA